MVKNLGAPSKNVEDYRPLKTAPGKTSKGGYKEEPEAVSAKIRRKSLGNDYQEALKGKSDKPNKYGLPAEAIDRINSDVARGKRRKGDLYPSGKQAPRPKPRTGR